MATWCINASKLVNDFSLSFETDNCLLKKIGYNIDVLLQTTCLVVNLFTVYIFAYLFDCMTVGRASY